jgi:lysozyme
MLYIADLSHHNSPTDFSQAKAWGIHGIIHKATEGLSNTDPTYASRRQLALNANLLWGAYHFFRPSDPIKQVSHFLSIASPDANTLLALDHEDSNCSAAMAITFLKELEQRIGRKCPLYSGHLIKEQLQDQVDSYLRQCPLWLAQYGPTAVLPNTWNDYFLWQFTGDGLGPGPHSVPGLGINIDLNRYQGTEEQLRLDWTSSSTSTSTSMQTSFNQWLQSSLNLFGAHLLVDGRFGPVTLLALRTYQAEQNLQVTGHFDSPTLNSLLTELQHRITTSNA